MRAALIIPGGKGGHVEVRTCLHLTPGGSGARQGAGLGLNRGEIGQAKVCRQAAIAAALSSPARLRRLAPTSPHGTRATASWGMVVADRQSMRSPIRAH